MTGAEPEDETGAFEIILRHRRRVAVPGPDPVAARIAGRPAVATLETELADRGMHLSAALRRRLAELSSDELDALRSRLLAAVDRAPLPPTAVLEPCDDLDEAARELLTELLMRQRPLAPSEVADLSGLRAHLVPEDLLRWLPPRIPVPETKAAVFAGLLTDGGTAYQAFALLPHYLADATDALRLLSALMGGSADLSVSPARGATAPASKVVRPVFDLLEAMAFEDVAEDMLRHREQWALVAELLRPLEDSLRFPQTMRALEIVRGVTGDAG